MSQLDTRIGPKIKAFRRQLGIQANKLADQLNISPSNQPASKPEEKPRRVETSTVKRTITKPGRLGPPGGKGPRGPS